MFIVKEIFILMRKGNPVRGKNVKLTTVTSCQINVHKFLLLVRIFVFKAALVVPTDVRRQKKKVINSFLFSISRKELGKIIFHYFVSFSGPMVRVNKSGYDSSRNALSLSLSLEAIYSSTLQHRCVKNHSPFSFYESFVLKHAKGMKIFSCRHEQAKHVKCAVDGTYSL